MPGYKLSQDRFYHLLDDIEAQGGFRTPNAMTCRPTRIPYPKNSGGSLDTHGCRKDYLVSVPYDGVEQKDGPPVKHSGLVLVCAEGDAMELWPRFQEES